MNVTTLEMSEKLKETGAPQTTDYVWRTYQGGIVDVQHLELKSEYQQGIVSKECAAYSLEELVGWLGRPYELRHLPTDTYEAICWTEDENGYVVAIKGESRSSLLSAVYNLAVAVKGEKHD